MVSRIGSAASRTGCLTVSGTGAPQLRRAFPERRIPSVCWSARSMRCSSFRRSGEPVPTPVWFGLHEGCVYVESLADAGKVKRLRHDRRVRVAPCTVRGRPKGPFADGVGRILGPAEAETAELALDRHYGLRRRLYVRLGTRLGVRSVYLELTPTAIDRA